MADDDTVTINIALDRSLHTRLKIGATMLNTSMKQYVIALLETGTPQFSEDGNSVAFVGDRTMDFIQAHLGSTEDDDEANT